jgi:hypothetical protein
MVALFSTLLSKNNEGDSSSAVSSSVIPTVIQLYTSTLIMNPSSSNTKSPPGHAILSYQATHVSEDASLSTQTATEEASSTLFGKRHAKNLQHETPNLGVWNCKVSPLMDSLLHIPSSSHHYVFTVNLSDPTTVEPDMTSMQQALVRHLIASSDTTPTNTTTTQTTSSTTTLNQLSNVTFGLAPEDTPPTTSVAQEENHDKIQFHLMICAIVPLNKKEYQETQAQNLVVYHLHRFAAAIGATLVFCQATDRPLNPTIATPEMGEQEEKDSTLATLDVGQVARVWRRFAQDSVLEHHDAIFDSNQDKELIETVFLRNANHPPAWNASTDSLWKALPAKPKEHDHEKKSKPNPSGDDAWLQQLRDSIASLATEPTATAAAAASTTSTSKAKQTEDAEVSSFFENLLKK